MDLKKVLDQTVRELKREVNKKVLKVPEIEQKVLDATSNEPWGPHGTLMADIAQATRNYNEYQMIMTILWKRINDTGRNWRHVYKALTILEYLVAHGSERVIDELKEHAYQISTLADFQYIDSSGKDQGLNVRKKSQALVALVNDKEKIREVRQKAASNRDKYRSVSSTGGIYKPSSYHSTSGSYGGDRYDDDSYSSASRYGSRDDDRYRDRDFDRYRDDDRYGRDGDRYSRDGDRYGRDGDRYSRDGDRYGRDGDRYSRDEYNREYEQEDSYHSSRRDDRQSEKYSSFERERDRSYDDDDRHSSRSGGRGDDYEMDDRRADRKAVGSRMPAPPSYEEALGSSDYGYGSAEEQRDGGGLAAAVARASKSNTAQATNGESTNVAKALPPNVQSVGFDEFDPRASTAPVPAAPTVAAPANFPTEDLFGSVDTVNGMKALPAPPAISNTTSNASDYFGDSNTAAFTPATVIPSNSSFQRLDADVFGDSPFKAEGLAFSANATASNHPPPSYTTNLGPATSGTELATRASSDSNGFNAFAVASANQTAAVSFAHAPANQSVNASYGGLEVFGNDTFTAFGGATNGLGMTSVSSTPPLPLSMPEAPQVNSVQPAAAWTFSQQSNPSGNLLQPTAMSASQHVIPAANQAPKPSTNSYTKPQQEKKFETKSTVWADTLSKGLIDLNIAGPKTNPLADIGIDFDLLRTERIKEERASTAKTSTTNMGKAMGSGSGLGLAGAGAIVPPAAQVMMNSMGMGMGPGTGMNSVGMGSGMGMAPAMPMGVNPGMAMRPGVGMGPVPGMGMGMNPMMGMGMGTGGYPNSQQQYSGYR